MLWSFVSKGVNTTKLKGGGFQRALVGERSFAGGVGITGPQPAPMPSRSLRVIAIASLFLFLGLFVDWVFERSQGDGAVGVVTAEVD
jgi:hypothetical protein